MSSTPRIFNFDSNALVDDATIKANVVDVLAPHLDSVGVLSSYGFDRPTELLINTGHYMQTARLPRGMVLFVGGRLPIFGPATLGPITDTAAQSPTANMHLILNERTGMGVSMYTVTTSGLTAEDIVARFCQPSAVHNMPRLAATSPLHRIAVTRAQTNHPSNQFAVIVTANDAPAAVKLMETLSDKPGTDVQTLVEMPAYSKLLESSQLYRDQLARETAAAHGVTIDPRARVTHLTHYIERAKGGLYAIYHDAYSAESSMHGLLIASGPTGDYLHVPEACGGPAAAIATSTAAYSTTVHTRAPVRFNEAIVAFDRELHDQPHTLATSLSASHAERPTPANAARHEFVVGVLPNVSTLEDYVPVHSLVDLARKTSAKSIAVPADHPVVAMLPQAIDELKAKGHLPQTYSLARALGAEFTHVNSDLLTAHSAHTDTHIATEKELSVDVLPTIATAVRPRFFLTPRRYRRGFGTAVALDVAFLAALGLLGPYSWPFHYDGRYYPRRVPYYY